MRGGESVGELDAALMHLETVLRRVNAPGVDALQPGLGIEAIERLTGGLPHPLPLELRSLYRWHDGSRLATAENSLFPGGGFPPLADAVRSYEDFCEGARRATEGTRIEPDLIYDSRWFPVFFSYGNSVYIIECGRAEGAGSVSDLLLEDSSQRELAAETLAAFIERVASRWEQGAYYLDQQPLEDYAALAAERRANDQSHVNVATLVQALTSGQSLERAKAARRLKEFLYPEAGPFLVELLGHPDRELRSIAVGILGLMADPSYVKALVSSLDDREYSVRERAKWALAEIQRRQRRRGTG